MSVVVAIEDAGPCRKQVTIEVPRPAVDAETERVLAEYRRRASVPGFRKGKAPAGVIRKRFGNCQNRSTDRATTAIATSSKDDRYRYRTASPGKAGLRPLSPPCVLHNSMT